MRKLSENFIDNLKNGFLSPITQEVINDKDLDLQIRDNYLNIYFKGNSILKLSEAPNFKYKVDIHQKFRLGTNIPNFIKNRVDTDLFLKAVPILKANILKNTKSSLEVEYEQLIIRANNQEKRNNSEYFIVDRQYAIDNERFDLLGVYWDRNLRRRNQTIIPCLMEVKFALNTDIREAHKQLLRYYEKIQKNMAKLSQELETMFRQKLQLGIYMQDPNRLEAMKTLKVSNDLNLFQFILILVDYNPYSSLLNLEPLSTLPFSNQIKIFFSGFSMWSKNIKTVKELSREHGYKVLVRLT